MRAELARRLAVPQERQTRSRRSQLVLLPVADDPTISFRIWFKVGSQNDPPGKEGLAAITGRDARRGARPSRTATSRSSTSSFRWPAGYSAVDLGRDDGHLRPRPQGQPRPSTIRCLIEAILAPAFKQEDLDRLKSQTLNYLENTLRYASDEELGKAVLYNDDLRRHALRAHSRPGRSRACEAITLDDVRDVLPQALHAGQRGDRPRRRLRRRRLLEQLQRDLAPLPPGKPAAGRRRREPQPIRGLQVTIVEKDAPATAISIGFPIDVLRGAAGLVRPGGGQLLARRAPQFEQPPVPGDPRGARAELRRLLLHRALSRTAAQLQVPPQNVCRRQQIFEIWIRPGAQRGPALRPAGGPAGIASSWSTTA